MATANALARRRSRRVDLTRILRRFRRRPVWETVLALGLVAFVVGFTVYAPALRGGFILDDLALPLAAGDAPNPLDGWPEGPRPVLMLSYRLNGMLLGTDPASFHFVNLLVHVANVCLVFLIVRALLFRSNWAGRRATFAAMAAAAIFLVHPLQTESVSYIAGRSESLAAFFLLAAYTLYLYDKRGEISWRRAIAVLALFAVAVKTKENAVSLAAILPLTDLMWPRPFAFDGLRRNWRLYALLVPGALVATVLIFRMLSTAQTAGFSVVNYTWYQYAFTESRAIFSYLLLAIAPVKQALDHDFAPSRTVWQHGAAAAIALLAGLTAAAIWRARRYPLACFGFLMFLAFLAPTSSFIPIDDALVERRMYLALIGLLLIACDVCGRVRWSRPAAVMTVGVALLALGGLCHARNQWWGRPELLLVESAANVRHNPRPLLNVSEALIRRDRCDLALPYLERAERILPRNYFVHAIRGRALACLNRLDEAMAHLQLAASLRSEAEVFEWIGLVYGQMGKSEEAGVNLRKAVELNPQSATAHGSLALWLESTGDLERAEREYALAASLSRTDATARARLEHIRQLRLLPTRSSL